MASESANRRDVVSAVLPQLLVAAVLGLLSLVVYSSAKPSIELAVSCSSDEPSVYIKQFVISNPSLVGVEDSYICIDFKEEAATKVIVVRTSASLTEEAGGKLKTRLLPPGRAMAPGCVYWVTLITNPGFRDLLDHVEVSAVHRGGTVTPGSGNMEETVQWLHAAWFIIATAVVLGIGGSWLAFRQAVARRVDRANRDCWENTLDLRRRHHERVMNLHHGHFEALQEQKLRHLSELGEARLASGEAAEVERRGLHDEQARLAQMTARTEQASIELEGVVSQLREGKLDMLPLPVIAPPPSRTEPEDDDEQAEPGSV